MNLEYHSSCRKVQVMEFGIIVFCKRLLGIFHNANTFVQVSEKFELDVRVMRSHCMYSAYRYCAYSGTRHKLVS